MSAFLVLLWQRYNRYLIVLGLLGLVVGGIYFKGRSDAKRQEEHAAIKDVENRLESVGREREATQRRRSAVRQNRERTPLDDARDSCILSSDPFSVDCLKEGKK